MSTRSPGKMKPATPEVTRNRNGDGAHARAERRGEEAAVVRTDQRTLGQRLAGSDRVAHDGADQLADIGVGRAFGVVGVLHQLLRPGLEGQAFGIDDGADRKRLAGDQNLRARRNDRRRIGLIGPGSGEHVLGHDSGNHRNDQRSDEQRDFLDVHGDYASPEGSLNCPETFRQIG